MSPKAAFNRLAAWAAFGAGLFAVARKGRVSLV